MFDSVLEELLFVGGEVEDFYDSADSFNGYFHGFIRFCFTIWGIERWLEPQFAEFNADRGAAYSSQRGVD